MARRASRSGSRKNAVDGGDRAGSAQKHWDTMSDQGRTGGSGDARPGRCDRHHDSGRTTKRPGRKRAGSVHELSCQAQDYAGDERGNWSRIPRNELMWRAGEGPLPPVGLKQCSDCWSSRQCPLSGAIRRTYTLLAVYCSCAGLSDACMTPPSTRADGRRPRSAKARNRGSGQRRCSGLYGDFYGDSAAAGVAGMVHWGNRIGWQRRAAGRWRTVGRAERASRRWPAVALSQE